MTRLPLPPRCLRRPARAPLRARSLLAAAATLLLATALPAARVGAQRKPAAEPKRPRFTVTRDSNSAGAYYYHGLSVLDRHPQEAADAFYWASRLEPDWAEPYFARRVALHLSNGFRLRDYVYGDPRARSSPERRQADSLALHARLLDPFLYRRLDRRLLERALDDFVRDVSREVEIRTGERPDLLPIRLNPGRIAGRDPDMAAWLAYTDGDFRDALAYYAQAIKHDAKAYELHSGRADVFYLVTQYDSALAELSTMLGQMRTLDDKHLVPFYDSKAFLEYQVGQVHVMRGDLDAARAAYERALTEDMSFYMAHAALGNLALVRHDTATALGEYAQAVDLAGGEPGLRYRYGVALFETSKFAAAADQFRKAVELDPYYAKPYFPLAYILEGSGEDAAAIAAYERFARSAPAADSGRVAVARERIAELRALSAAPPAASAPASPPPAKPPTSR